MTFEEIIRAVSFYDRYSFINRILFYLKDFEKQKTGLIWHLLLLLKWVLLEGRNSGIVMHDKTFAEIMKGIEGLEMGHPIIKEKNKISFLNGGYRLLGNQQTYLQTRIEKDSFARNIVMFNKLDTKGYYRKKFKDTTKIDILDFINLFFLLHVYTRDEISNYKNTGILSKDFFELGSKITDRNTIAEFVNLLSVNTSNAKTKIKPFDKIKSPIFQVWEQSVFTRFPLFHYDKSMYVLHKNLLSQTVNHYIYDTFKEYDERFDKFGKDIFEKYVELGIKELSLKYLTDTDLKALFKKDNNLTKKDPNANNVDFVIDDSILIECKAIELSPIAAVNPTDDIIRNFFDNSVIKAYVKQMFTVANYLKRHTNKEFWGIILTYKELFYDNGEDGFSELIKNILHVFCEKNNIDESLIPAENLYFIDILTWDKLILILKHTNLSLRQILEDAREQDKNEATKMGAFFLHLNKYGSFPFDLGYINDGFKLLIDKNQ